MKPRHREGSEAPRISASRWRFAGACATLAGLLLVQWTLAASAETAVAKPDVVRFNGVDYMHRWSKNGQNEYTPATETDLARWQNMVTLNVHEKARTGEDLAQVANTVVANYGSHGKILRTDSKPRTPDRPAEHLVVAVLGNPDFLEAAFARFVLVDGTGMVAVYSHRVYGKNAGPAMSDWLKTNGPPIETALMAWKGIPSAKALKLLPQSR
jgi:hypothetical protein